ncbi:MAG: carbonic anhydrase [Ignavibacteriales bacterium]|nr:carbonic anhydrase [Ignavibacteriales bacterium]HOJ17120.1 carbonic anhydrase [Ignavibacteriaceae bacterium]HPO56969.1 carbonic anhydrase [Ignavibacteriaceae bacterium]
MKTIKYLPVLLVLMFLIYSCSEELKNEGEGKSEEREIVTSDGAIDELKRGNERFLAGKLANTNYAEQIEKTKEEQKPHSVILTCMDSRVPPEILFDQGIGKIFVVRNAGNIEDENVLGSMEYAVKFSTAKLIVVMGHSHCGAVKGAIKEADAGNLTQLLNQIKPFIPEDRSRSDLVEETAKLSMQNTVTDILNKSPIIKELVDSGSIKIVTAFYDIETGKVFF